MRSPQNFTQANFGEHSSTSYVNWARRRAEAANSPDPFLDRATIRKGRYGGLPQEGDRSFVVLFDGRRALFWRPAPLVALAHRWPERGSQPVGSLVTKASSKPLKVLSKAPRVVG